jgi:hypothetical protein
MSSTGKTPEHTAYSLPEGVDGAVAAAEAVQSAQAAEAAQSTQAAEAAQSTEAAEAVQSEAAEAAVPASFSSSLRSRVRLVGRASSSATRPGKDISISRRRRGGVLPLIC